MPTSTHFASCCFVPTCVGRRGASRASACRASPSGRRPSRRRARPTHPGRRGRGSRPGRSRRWPCCRRSGRRARRTSSARSARARRRPGRGCGPRAPRRRPSQRWYPCRRETLGPPHVPRVHATGSRRVRLGLPDSVPARLPGRAGAHRAQRDGGDHGRRRGRLRRPQPGTDHSRCRGRRLPRRQHRLSDRPSLRRPRDRALLQWRKGDRNVWPGPKCNSASGAAS